MIVAECLVAGRGRVDPDLLAGRLLGWQDRMVAAGSADLLGPSTLRALRLVAAGAPAGTTGRWGDTDGAAHAGARRWASPSRPSRWTASARRVADLDRLTHDTTVAIAGACAVAAVVSAGVAGAAGEEPPLGLQAARPGGRLVQLRPGSATSRRRIRWALDLVRDADDDTLLGPGRRAGRHRRRHPGGGARRVRDRRRRAATDPWRAGLLAARLGGDSDTIAAMAGGDGRRLHRARRPARDGRPAGTPGQRARPGTAGRRPAARSGQRDEPAGGARAAPSSTWCCTSTTCPSPAATCWPARAGRRSAAG